jgi:Zn-dependent metalloprotease
MDPESAAKRILQQSLESSKMPKLTAPKIGSTTSDFKSLGVETVQLTNTMVVKFRQMVDNIPVYGSLISVELDSNHDCVSINSNLAKPKVKSHTAKVSQMQASQVVAKEAGYSAKSMPQVTPELNFYADSKGVWHLAYIFPNVHSAPGHGAAGKNKKADHHSHFRPRNDYVVDALTGKLIAVLPRTPALSNGIVTAVDELGANRRLGVVVDGANKLLMDTDLNIRTHDFGFDDPDVHAIRLPGKVVKSPPPFSSASVSAHANAAEVARFMRETLKRNNIDNKGGLLVSVVNSVIKSESPDGKQWANAFWDGKQMVYGQTIYGGKLRSIAASLDVVAHEFFHGVTEHTANLAYEFQSGALNESFSDIFGTLISNAGVASVDNWNWLIGDGLLAGEQAFRSMKDPTEFDQPKHMKNYQNLPNTEQGDWGGVHINSGIHNYAAYRLMIMQAAGKYLFKPSEVAAMYYITVTQHLSRQSSFADSLRGMLVATRSLFRTMPTAQVEKRVRAVQRAFKAAGIV